MEYWNGGMMGCWGVVKNGYWSLVESLEELITNN